VAEAAAILAGPRPAAAASPVGGGWLDGLKVHDLTNVIVGPTAHCIVRFDVQNSHARTMRLWEKV